jgi:hypothetical protein
VREFLNVAANELTGHSRFLAKSSVYVLGICERELRDGPVTSQAEQEQLTALVGADGTPAQLRNALSGQIRSGTHDDRWEALVAGLLAANIHEVRIVKASHLAPEHLGTTERQSP